MLGTTGRRFEPVRGQYDPKRAFPGDVECAVTFRVFKSAAGEGPGFWTAIGRPGLTLKVQTGAQPV
jgi:hypothetical protein